jgi:threonine dehydratase
MSDTYIERILRARVYDVAMESPLETAPRLSRRIGNSILLKREDLQPVFSFKLRGAYNKIAHLSDSVAKRGVICASAGNHAQGVALAARRRGISALIVMPQTTPNIKVSAVRDLGRVRWPWRFCASRVARWMPSSCPSAAAGSSPASPCTRST